MDDSKSSQCLASHSKPELSCACFASHDQPESSFARAMEEFEQKLEVSMAKCLEDELKSSLTDEVHTCMQTDLENELMEFLRSDLLAFEDFNSDELDFEPEL